MDEFFVCSFEGTIYLQYGPVAQLVRAPPCHGGGREFESLLGRLRWGLSSAGRASALQAEGHRFEPCILHMVHWSSGLSRLPVTEEIAGSNPAWTVIKAAT